MQYYFVSFFASNDARKSYQPENELIELHPLAYIERLNLNVTADEDYVLISWQEITKQEYESYK